MKDLTHTYKHTQPHIYHVTAEAELCLEFDVESKGMVVITGSDE